MRLPPTAFLVLALVPATLAAENRTASLVGFGFDEPTSSAPYLAEARTNAKGVTSGLVVFARVELGNVALSEPDAASLEARLASYAATGVAVVLGLGVLPPDAEAATVWTSHVRRLAERTRGKVWGYELGKVARGLAAPDPQAHAYALKLAAVQLRSVDPGGKIVSGPLGAPDAAWLKAVYAEDTAAYVDAVAVEAEVDATPLAEFMTRHDPDAILIRVGVPLPEDARAASRVLVERLLEETGRFGLVTFRAARETVPAVLSAGGALGDVLAGQVVTIDPAAVHLGFRIDGQDATTRLPHRVLYNLTTFSTYVAYWGEVDKSGTLEVQIEDAAGKRPMVRDLLTSRYRDVAEFSWDAATRTSRIRVSLEGGVHALDFNVGATASYVSRVDVAGRVLPPVAEIISRHQQAQAAQDAVVANYTSLVHMEQHFRTSATDPGFDVVTENRFYFDRQDGSEWEELSFTLNGSRWGPKRPPFPLLQAEKVLSLPLDLRLSRDYAYDLEGVETVDGRECYQVRFSPRDAMRSLYRGSVWIDTETFLKLKVQAVQTQLQAPVVASEEVQSFGPVAEVDGRKVRLFDQLTSRQTVLIAGRNLLVEREVRFTGFELNAPDFSARRGVSRASSHVMYRDTEAGLRYFVKKGEARVVQDQPTTRATALAAGVNYDPSYDFPLPILGLNHLDFEFLGKKRQLALLYGGVLALVNVQQPRALGKKTDLSVDMFAIAIRGNDQVFDAEGERRRERLRTLPFNLGANLGFQLDAFNKLSMSYQFRYDNFIADELTDANFRVPTSGVTNGVGVAYEFKRWGYAVQGSAFFHRRARWSTWGRGEEYRPADRSYQRYGLSLTKDFFWGGGVHKVHTNLAYFGGAHLDRFTAYQSGLFDENKLHGVPSAGVRFVEQAMFRGAYTFNLFELYRIDLFVDQALGRPPARTEWQHLTGLGVGLNLRGPWNTLVRAEVGKSFLDHSYRGAGSFVGQILFLKPL